MDSILFVWFIWFLCLYDFLCVENSYTNQSTTPTIDICTYAFSSRNDGWWQESCCWLVSCHRLLTQRFLGYSRARAVYEHASFILPRGACVHPGLSEIGRYLFFRCLMLHEKLLTRILLFGIRLKGYAMLLPSRNYENIVPKYPCCVLRIKLTVRQCTHFVNV